MSQKLPINGFKWVKQKTLWKFIEDFIKNYDENSNKGYFLEVDIDHPKKLFNIHKDLQFLTQIKKIEKVEKLICSIENKRKICYSHRSFKRIIKSWVKTKNRVIKFKQKAWLKVYNDMNTELRKMNLKNVKNEFEKNLFKLMNNSVFGKTMENVRNLRDIKLATSDKRRKLLVS